MSISIARYGRVLILVLAMVGFGSSGYSQAGQNVSCIIASLNSGGKYRTDVALNCRINTQTGAAQFTVKGKVKTRNYLSKTELTQAHINLVTRLMRTARMDTRRNPAQFDISAFLNAASKATSGFVLVRTSKGKTALNIVYITDGVYRSIDLPGTNLRAKPKGMLTTGPGF